MNRGRDDDERARIERASRLRAQIDQLTKGGAQEGKEPSPPPLSAPPKSPRDFIHEKMAELAKRKKKR